MIDHEHCPVCGHPICRLWVNRRYKCPHCDKPIMRFGHPHATLSCGQHGQFAEWDACISLCEYAYVKDTIKVKEDPEKEMAAQLAEGLSHCLAGNVKKE